MIIVIDGPAGTGKSTLARKVAQELGYTYFDTGAMYRTITYALLKQKISLEDLSAIISFLKMTKISVRSIRGEKRYFLGQEDVTEYLRLDEVNASVSQVSSLKVVRDILVSYQQELGRGVNAVFEGRDMGTVVFPQADLKLFLTARPEIRAERRYQEMIAHDPGKKTTTSLQKVLEDINKRDSMDSSRELSPLKPASDAVTIDTSDLSIEEVMNKILELKDQLKIKKTSH